MMRNWSGIFSTEWRTALRRACAPACIALAGWFCLTMPAAAATDWGKAMVESTMQRFPDARALPWRYPRALYLYGQYLVYQRTKDDRYWNYIVRWADAHVDDAGNMYFDAARREPVDLSSELDHLLPGRLMLILYRATGIEKYRLAAGKLRQRFDDWPRTTDGGLLHRWRLPGQLWADGTYMALPFLAEYGQMLGDATTDPAAAAGQLLLYGTHLQDPGTGLLYHGYDETGTAVWANATTHRSPEFWCRGVGWYATALVEVLDALPASDPQRSSLLERLRGLAAGIVRFQDSASGRWFEVVDKGTLKTNWLETSCSSLFAYTLGHAVERGYLPATYQEAASRGYQGVLDAISLDAAGRTSLVGTVIGTSVGNLAYYLGQARATDDWHGLGAFLIMHEQFNHRPATAVFRWWEAESGKVTAPLRIKADAKASGGRFIQVAAGSNSVAKPPSKGIARYVVQLARTSQYRLWGRTIAPTAKADSFWLRIDGGPWRPWYGIALSKAWRWSDVHATATGGQPVDLALAAGSHVIEIAYREEGARLDKLLLTNVPNFVPGGPGG